MIAKLLKRKWFIPNEFHDSVEEINLEELKNRGIRLILSDLDNTLISYDEDIPTKENLEFFNKIQELGMEIVLVSNNIPPRIQKYTEKLDILGFANARKPSRRGLRKAHQSSVDNYSLDEVCLIGDQLMTDVFGANRYKIYSILVNPIKKKTEKWYTRMNRKIEVQMLERIKNETPKIYNELGLDKRR